MPEACSQCGESCEKAGGRYRDLCPSCIYQEAQGPSHVQLCEQTECLICDSWLRETRGWVGYLYAATMLYKSRLENENYRLEQFK